MFAYLVKLGNGFVCEGGGGGGGCSFGSGRYS